MEEFDVVVIGSGPGGYPAAIQAARLGARTAIVERENLGGTCLNWGCIPTKTLIASSDLYYRMRHADRLGLKVGSAGYDYAAMVRRKDAVVEKLRGGVGQLLKGNGVTVLQGSAAFVERNVLAVTDGKERSTVKAKKVIIAAGADSAMPGFLPRSSRVVEARGFLELKDLPANLLVLGGGVIGCEFACLAAQLGAQVTVVEMLEDILVMLDRDVRQVLRNAMEASGIRILTGAAMKDIQVGKTGVTAQAGEEKLAADLLLVAVGRRPLTTGLGLEKAGLTVTASGHIETDAHCRTAVAGIYAVGDVTAGSTQLAHEATSQGVLAAECACSGSRRTKEAIVPSCIFTAPEIGLAGLTEDQARASGRPVKKGKFMFAGLGKAMAADETTGFVKWIADDKTDQLLGAQAVGPHATELITEAAVAIRAELTAAELGRTIHCHPTFAEAWMEAAHDLHGACIHGAPKRRK